MFHFRVISGNLDAKRSHESATSEESLMAFLYTRYKFIQDTKQGGLFLHVFETSQNTALLMGQKTIPTQDGKGSIFRSFKYDRSSGGYREYGGAEAPVSLPQISTHSLHEH